MESQLAEMEVQLKEQADFEEEQQREIEKLENTAKQKDAALAQQQVELATMLAAKAAAEKALEEASRGGSEKDAALAARAKELASMAAAKSELEGGLKDMHRAAQEKDAILSQRAEELAALNQNNNALQRQMELGQKEAATMLAQLAETTKARERAEKEAKERQLELERIQAYLASRPQNGHRISYLFLM